MVHSLAYVSAAHPGLTQSDLQELQEQSRRHNSTTQITGLLLYRGGTFVQFLEGDEDDVEALFGRIVTDQRNRDVTLVRRRNQPARHFPTWTSAFDRADSTSTGKLHVEMPPTLGPAPQPETDAAFLAELLDLFDH